MIVLGSCKIAAEHYVNCLVLRWAGDWKVPSKREKYKLACFSEQKVVGQSQIAPTVREN